MSLPPVLSPYLIGDKVVTGRYADDQGVLQATKYIGPGPFVEDRFKPPTLDLGNSYKVDFNRDPSHLVKRIKVSGGTFAFQEDLGNVSNPSLWPADNSGPVKIRFLWVRHECNELRKTNTAPDAKDIWADTTQHRLQPAPWAVGGQPYVPSQDVMRAFGISSIPVLRTANGTDWRPNRQLWYRDRAWFDLADTASWYLFPTGGKDPNGDAATPNLKNGEVFTLGARVDHPNGFAGSPAPYSQTKFTLSGTDQAKPTDVVAVLELTDLRFRQPFMYTISWEQAVKLQKGEGQQTEVNTIPDPPAPTQPVNKPSKWKSWPSNPAGSK